MMKMTRKRGLLVAPLAMLAVGALLGGCSKDPVADGAGTPIVIQTSRSLMNVKVGDTFSMTGQVLDVRMTPLVTTMTVTSSNAAAVPIDSVVFSVPVSQTVVYMRGVGTKADSSTVTWTSGSLTSTTKVVVTP